MKKRKRELKKLYRLPGELIYTGNVFEKITKIKQVSYLNEEYKVYNNYNPKEGKDWNNFVIVEGLGNVEGIKNLGKEIGVHKLILEDILNTSQNIKVSIHEGKVFVVVKHFSWNDSKKEILDEQISFILKENYLFVFLEKENKLVSIILERIREKMGVIRENNVEYLLFALLDIFTDDYLALVSEIGESILKVEEEVNSSPEDTDIKDVFTLKKNIMNIKKNLWYLREMMKKILLNEKEFDRRYKIYYEDLYDKSLKINDYIDDCKEEVNELINYHMTLLSNNMNKIMKVLTFISTVFIPISFLAGLFGMNFKYMPELDYRYSYYILLIVMVMIVLAMVRFFKNKKWF